MNAIRDRISWPIALVLAAVAGFAGYSTQASRAGATMQPAMIASVNLEALFEGLDAYASANDELVAMGRDLETRGQAKREEVELLRQDLELLTPGSDAYRATEEDIVWKTNQLRAFIEFAGRKLDEEHAHTLRRIYEEVKAVVRSAAEESGYDLVLVDHSQIELPENVGEVETMRQITSRRMLYSSPEIDITNDLIARMNNAGN